MNEPRLDNDPNFPNSIQLFETQFSLTFFGEDVAEDFDFAAHTRISTGNDKFYTRFPIEKK